MSQAKEGKQSYLVTETEEDEPPAQALWNQVGFRIIADLVGSIAERDP